MPAASHPVPSPDRNHAPIRRASTTRYSQGFRFLFRHSRRRLGSPWVGPINAALKRLKLATVTPGATSTLSASSASLFPCHRYYVLGRLFIFLHPRGHKPTAPFTYCAIYQTLGSSAAVVQSPVMPNSRRSSATQSVHSLSFSPGPRFPVCMYVLVCIYVCMHACMYLWSALSAGYGSTGWLPILLVVS